MGPATPAAPAAFEREALEPPGPGQRPSGPEGSGPKAQELQAQKLDDDEQAAANAAEPPRFTEEQQSLEDLADRAMAGIDLSANEARIVSAVQAAATWEEAIENLLALWPELDMDTLTEMVERATVAAEMFGRSSQTGDEAVGV